MMREPTLSQVVGNALLGALVVRTVPASASSPERVAAALDRLEAAVAAVEAALRDLQVAQASMR